MATENKMIGYRPDPTERALLEAYKAKTGLPFSRVLALALREKAERDGMLAPPPGMYKRASDGAILPLPEKSRKPGTVTFRVGGPPPPTGPPKMMSFPVKGPPPSNEPPKMITIPMKGAPSKEGADALPAQEDPS